MIMPDVKTDPNIRRNRLFELLRQLDQAKRTARSVHQGSECRVTSEEVASLQALAVKSLRARTMDLA
jgi:hypothetical protein